MKQFIKEHPWRLEIVPGLIVLFTIVWPLVFRSEMFATDLSRVKFWYLNYAWTILMVLLLSCLDGLISHNYVRGERVKRFFYGPPLWALSMCILGWSVLDWRLYAPDIRIHHINPSVVHHSHVYNLVWLALIPLTCAAQALIEWTRPFAAAPEKTVQGASDVRPGDPFYYQEVIFDWILILTVPLLLISWGYALMMILTLTSTRIFWPIVIGLIATAAATWLAVKKLQVTYVISSERVSCRNPGGRMSGLWAGGTNFSIKMTDIRACSVFWVDSTKVRLPYLRPNSPDYMRPFLPRDKFGNCLRVETNDGKTYLLGVNNPETACKLIQTTIEAQKSEAQQ